MKSKRNPRAPTREPGVRCAAPRLRGAAVRMLVLICLVSHRMAQGKPPVLSKVYLLGYLSPPMIKEMQDVAALAGCAALDLRGRVARVG